MKEKKAAKWNAPVHPGEILAEELEAIDMTAASLAEKIGVPKNRLYQIIRGQRALTADTALRLGRFFGTGPNLWLTLQKNHELDLARAEIGAQIRRIRPYTPGSDSRVSAWA
jgi:addiction module HigA family antidote